MNQINSKQADRLLEDIASIKEVINRNRPVLRQIINLAMFRWFLLVVGLCVIGFSLSIYFLTNYYGNFSSIPGMLRILIYSALAVSVVILQIWKGRAYLASVKRIDRRLNLGWALKEFYSNQISHIYVAVVALMLFLSVFFVVKHIPYYIIPMLSICMALIVIAYGVILQIKYSLYIGYWCFLTGICMTIFNTIPAPIALSVTLGCTMLILSFFGFQFRNSDMEA